MARCLVLAASLVFLFTGCGGPSLSGAVADLEDKGNDPEVRLAAVDDLVATGDPEAVAHLQSALEDAGEDPRIRAKAAGGLGFFQNPDSIDILVKALDDPDPEVRRQAGRSLVQFGEKAVQPLVRSLGFVPEELDDTELYTAAEERRIAASRALVAIGEPAVAPLNAALAEYERESFYKAMLAFANPKIPLYKEVTAAIQGYTPDPAEDFADTKIDSVGRFLNRISNENAIPRKYITLSLQALQNPAPTYLEILRADPVSEAALEVTERVFGRLKLDAINALITKRESEDKSLRVMCTHYLGYLGLTEATTALVDILADTSEYAGPDVKKVALESLGRIGTTKAIAALFDALKYPDLRETAADELEANGAPATKLLLARLSDPDPKLRALAIWFFGNTTNQSLQAAALPKLLENLTQEVKVLRENAAVALGKMPTVAFEQVAALAGDERPEVRQAVAIALGEMAVPEARPYLEKLAADADENVAQSANEALLRLE
jgi:HEAT repeat protein